MVQKSSEDERKLDYVWLVLFFVVFINGLKLAYIRQAFGISDRTKICL